MNRGVVEHMLNRLDSPSHKCSSYIAGYFPFRCMGNRVPLLEETECFVKNLTTVELIVTLTFQISRDCSKPYRILRLGKHRSEDDYPVRNIDEPVRLIISNEPARIGGPVVFLFLGHFDRYPSQVSFINFEFDSTFDPAVVQTSINTKNYWK